MRIANSCPTLGLFNFPGCVTEFDSGDMLNNDQDYSIFSDKLYAKRSNCKRVSHSNFENTIDPQRETCEMNQSQYEDSLHRRNQLRSLEPFHRLASNIDFVEKDDISSLHQLRESYYHELSMNIGSRLSRFYKRWEKVGASAYVVCMLRCGLTLEWIDVTNPPPLTYLPNVISIAKDKDKMSLMRTHVSEMLEKGAIHLVTDNSLGFYSRIFMVPKQGGKWRPVIDLSVLNKFIRKESFKMETPELIRSSFVEGEWVTSIDLKDAYFHVPVALKFRKYMRFMIDDKVYEFLSMPFGLSTAPKIFTTIVVEFKKVAMTRGFNLNQYLDDWINRDLSQVIAQNRIWQLLQLVVYLGFLPNYDKSSLEPSQQFDFLGGSYDLLKQTVKPTVKRVGKILAITDTFQNSKFRTVRQFMSLIGLLIATMNQVDKMGRMHIRPIQWHLGRNWSNEESLDKKVPVPESLNCHFGWWGCRHHLTEGVPLHPKEVNIQLVTDSSDVGWGAHCQGQQINGLWEYPDIEYHINIKELKTVLIAMRYFSDLIKDKTVLVLCDNSTAVSYIDKQGGLKSHKLYSTTFLIYSLAKKLNIDLQIRHVAGALNVIADRLSRQGKNVTIEWSLNPITFKAICEALGTPLIDLFATEENFKLPVYVSPIVDPNAYAIDALSIDWTGMDAYMYPPSALISRILHKANTQPCKITLVAPCWSRAIWFWELIHLSSDRPLKISFRKRLLSQFSGPNRKQWSFEDDAKYDMWNLHVWSLDFRPNITKTIWWKQFQTRKLLAPEKYCQDLAFTGSLNDKVEFWLQTGWVG